jgi:lysophospholipase L1-like esterase
MSRLVLVGFAALGLVVVVAAAQSQPRALIIGDSISIGYTPFVQEILAGKVAVEHNEGNGADSANILAKLDGWLARGPYAVITVNCGLHDLKYTDKFQVPPVQYAANVVRIIEKLRAASAKVVWVTTTPVDDDRHAQRKAGFRRIETDVATYNTVATPIMRNLRVPVVDLHDLVVHGGVSGMLGKDGVHYTPEAYRKLAGEVAAAILEQLK